MASSSGVSIQVLGLDELRRDMRKPESVLKPAERALDKASAKTMELAVKGAPSDRGHLRNSITIDRLKRFVRRVGSGLPYAKPVEFGSRPHWPPLASLQPWARRHGFPAGRQGAFLVARAIARHGTKAKPFLNPALDRVETHEWPRIQREFNAEVGIEYERAGRRSGR